MRSLFPSPHAVVHISRQLNKAGPKDSHGNYQQVTSSPVVRKAQSIAQFGRRGSSRAVFTSETQDREEIYLHMVVSNPEVYANGDQVLIDPTIDQDGNYVSGTGTAYWIDGDPSDERKGPWPKLLSQFGGLIKLRRVT